MKRLTFAHGVEDRIVDLDLAGADFYQWQEALEALQRGRELPRHFRDHALRPPLKGYRSCIVGYTAGDNSIVAVYQPSPRRVLIVWVDEHDAAYETVIQTRTT